MVLPGRITETVIPGRMKETMFQKVCHRTFF